MAELDVTRLGLEIPEPLPRDAQIVEAMLIMKVAHLTDNETSLEIARTPGLDWIAERGLLDSAKFQLDNPGGLYDIDEDDSDEVE